MTQPSVQCGLLSQHQTCAYHLLDIAGWENPSLARGQVPVPPVVREPLRQDDEVAFAERQILLRNVRVAWMAESHNTTVK